MALDPAVAAAVAARKAAKSAAKPIETAAKPVAPAEPKPPRRKPGPKPGDNRIPGRQPKRKPRGRPTDFSPELGRLIASKVAKSIPLSVAARAVGVLPSVVYDWFAKGCVDQDSEFADFANSIEQARGIAVENRINRLNSAASGGQVISRTRSENKDGATVTAEKYAPADWRVDQWLLQVTERELFGAKEQSSGNPTTIGTINIAVSSSLGDAELATLAKLLHRAGVGATSPQTQENPAGIAPAGLSGPIIIPADSRKLSADT